MLKRVLLLTAFLAASLFGGYFYVFSVPDKPQLVMLSENGEPEQKVCYRNPDQALPLDTQGKLGVVVWNIYKQGRDNWESALNAYSQQRQLVLLQEASINPEFMDWLGRHQWASSHVSAFKAFDTSAGVLNLAAAMPQKACAYTQKEPWLQLPKSGLYAEYALSDGQSLAVVNVHAVNFTLGTVEFRQQIDRLRSAIDGHQGPVLVAGDFNAWSDERTQAMRELMAILNLTEVTFSPDNRTQFVTGHHLDYAFYRGLELKTAEAPLSDASDHNPLLLEFVIR